MSKPSSVEIAAKYKAKLSVAQEKITRVRLSYKGFKTNTSSSGLQYEVIEQGHKIMLSNLQKHIVHCKHQIAKYELTESNN